jgi:hypothetical protein
MEARKPFKYYAIRVANTIVIRRTVGHITLVRSRLYKPNSGFEVEQLTYTGGKSIGTMSYNEWVAHGGLRLAKHAKITREQYQAMRLFLHKGE